MNAKKPKTCTNESDGCHDTYVEVMKLNFEEENISKKQECSKLTIDLEATGINCVKSKKAIECDRTLSFLRGSLRRFLSFHRINCAPEYIDIWTSGNGGVREKAPKRRRVHRHVYGRPRTTGNHK